MKSTEFLTEAESNLALKKLDKYLDMLSDDNLRGLIPLVKQSLTTNEADNRIVQYNVQRMKAKNAAAAKAVASNNKTNEESKVAQTISSLSAEEKKELLSLLQKEAKSRPAAAPIEKTSSKQPAKKQSVPKKVKKDNKGPGMLKGCLLPIVGIIGLLSLIPDDPNSSTADSEQTMSVDVVDPFTYPDGAEYHTIKVRDDLENPNIKIYIGKRISPKSEEELSALGLSKESYSIYAVDLKKGKGIEIKSGFQTDFDDEASATAQFNRGIPTGRSYDLVPGSTQYIRYNQLKNKFNNGN